jgi:putative copper export protein
VRFVVSSLVAPIAVLAAAAAPASAADPPPGAVLAQPPAQVSAPGESGRLTVFDVNHEQIASGPATGTPLPHVGDGLYTVVTASGSSAFTVGPAQPAKQAVPPTTLKPVSETVPKWLYFVFGMIFIGALGLRRLAIRESTEAIDRRLLGLAGVGVIGFVVADLWQLHEEAPEGTDLTLWIIRLALTAVAVAVIVPAAIRPRRVQAVCTAGVILGAWELLVRVLPDEVPDDVARTSFTQLLDWGHLMFASIWIGGLAGLALLAVTRAGTDGFWPLVLRRFSLIATVCVGAMVLTGLWTAWIHVGPPQLLFHTLYGETLLVKLILVLILVGLGAVNQLWLLPRINAIREVEGGGSVLAVAVRHFRVTLSAEAIIGLLVLLVVPFLSGSARNQDFQRHDGGLVQVADGVTLHPSALRPGTVDYDVTAPGAKSVVLAFSSTKLGVPATTVPAVRTGDGSFRASGPYASMVGDWHVDVKADARTAGFDLPIAAEDPEPVKAPQPEIQGSTWAWGTGEVLLVLAGLFGAGRASQLITRRRRSAV